MFARLFGPLVAALVLVCAGCTTFDTNSEDVVTFVFAQPTTECDAGGFTGLDAGDAICQARAAAASLPNAVGYRAWLSDSVDDAYCRMHNLNGKRATNCGQPSLPASAGPWWRTDGKPFGAGLPDLVAPLGEVLNPPAFYEFGADLAVGGAWTGTAEDGAAGSFTCADWTVVDDPEPAFMGLAYRTATSWMKAGSAPCSSPQYHLYCFETGVADPLPPFPASGRLAFLTSAYGTGELGSWPNAGSATGLEAGDAICRDLAALAGIRQADSFRAWLSASGTNAIDRFEHDGPWMRLDGIEVAASRVDLTSGYLESPINLTDTGAYVGNDYTWTGTQADGSATPTNCSGWMSSGTTGEWGSANTAVGLWTASGPTDCGFPGGHLYCLQDLPLIFLDGFESAGTQAWTTALP